MDIYKENLTQTIIEKIYGDLKDDYYRLLDLAQDSPNANTAELNLMYERMKAVTGA